GFVLSGWRLSSVPQAAGKDEAMFCVPNFGARGVCRTTAVILPIQFVGRDEPRNSRDVSSASEFWT
ncbi:MAG: hypothetical protein KDJ20_05540, partial [Hyphomicrobiales bacterium]|nr:hypothetical protein [Hyphomicrobiales bacterium]